MQILGIDPGTGRTGWGIIRIVHSEGLPILEYIAHGCIVTNQEDLMSDRLQVLHQNIKEIIGQYNPDCMAVEHIFFGRNQKTAISVSQARGVILLAASQHKTPIYEYTGITVKHHLSGNGRVDKKDIQVIVRHILNKDEKKLSFNSKDKAFDDAADALAIAITHAHKFIEKERGGVDNTKQEKRSGELPKKKKEVKSIKRKREDKNEVFASY